MPTFGDYETFEEVAVHEQPGHVTTVYKAKKLGGSGDQVYAIKVFIPLRPPDPVKRSEDELGEDPAAGFIEGIKRLKQAQVSGGTCLVPVHDFGLTDGGAWFATDFAQRQSIGEFIIRQLKPDGDALRNVVSSVVTGCLALKRATGRSHGSLRPSNILLSGTGHLPLRKTPLQLMDPYPASLSVINKLSPSDRKTVSSMLEEALELQDLRCIGELIFQLVEQRLVHGFDYNLPTSTSPAWTGLGKDGEYWRELCLKLLDPNLALEKVSLQSLATEFPAAKASKLPLILAGVGVLVVLLGGGFVAVKVVGKKIEAAKVAKAEAVAETLRQYEAAMAAGQTAFGQGRWQAALDQAQVALRLKPADSAGVKLKADAEEVLARLATAAGRERSYQVAVAAGQKAFSNGQWQEALDQANAALLLNPGDAAGGKLKADAERELAKVAATAEIQRKYQATLAAGKEAFGIGQWQAALDQARAALLLKPSDPAAAKLETDSERELARLAMSAENQRKYEAAIAAGRDAFSKRQWQVAVNQATAALELKPDDPSAVKLRADAEREMSMAASAAERERKYQAAMTAGKEALGKEQWQTALDQAKVALVLKPADPTAAKLKTDAERELALVAAAAENQRKYQAAMAAGKEALVKEQWQAALDQAKAALVLKPADPAAVKLKTDAERELAILATAAENQRKHQMAMAAGKEAFGKGQWQSALDQANAALLLVRNDQDALDLKREVAGKIAEVKQEKAFSDASASFETGEYGDAEAFCNSYPTVPKFKQLLTEIQQEQVALSGAGQKLGQADYSFIREVEQASYANKDPFQKLLSEGRAEQKSLATLQTLREQEKWSELLQQSAALNARVLGKAQFKALVVWAQGRKDEALQQALQELATLDLALEKLCDQFNVKIPREIRTPGRKKEARMTALGFGGEKNPYKKAFLGQVRVLRAKYEDIGKLSQDSREETLTKLEKSILTWQ